MYPFEYHGAVLFNSHPQLFDLRFRRRLNTDGYQWSRSQWQGGWGFYTGTATAGRGATLAGLAEMLTSDGNDWRELSRTESVKAGQVVPINPLLKKLELLARLSTVAATKKFNAAGFNAPEVTITADEIPSSAVNAYFGPTPYGSPDCDTASSVVQAKGLLDAIGEAAFNALGLSAGALTIKTKQHTLRSMLLGDRGWIQNFEDYLLQAQDEIENGTNGGAFQAENVVKVGQNQFWGFIEAPRKGVKDALGWENDLRAAYKAVAGNSGSGRFPGFDGQAKFPDIADVAMKLFDLRSKR